jgi:hypothetical protein
MIEPALSPERIQRRDRLLELLTPQARFRWGSAMCRRWRETFPEASKADWMETRDDLRNLGGQLAAEELRRMEQLRASRTRPSAK